MVVGDAIIVARLAIEATSKVISLLSAIRKEQNETSAKKDAFRLTWTSVLKETALAMQLGLEIVLEHIQSSKEEEFENYAADDWCKLLRDATLSSGVMFAKHIADLPLALSKIIPDLLLLKEQSGEELAKSKDYFQIACLLPSALFEREVKTIEHFMISSLALSLKLCALVLLRFPGNPELLSMTIISSVEQLEESRVPVPVSAHKSNKMVRVIKPCILNMFVLISRLAPYFRPRDRKRIQGLLENGQTMSLMTLLAGNVFISELQISFGQHGVTEDDFDGIVDIAMNSKGQLMVAEQENYRVKAVTKHGQCLWICSRPVINEQDDMICRPVAMTVDRNDQVIVVMSRMNELFMVQYDSEGKFHALFEIQHQWLGDAKICGIAVNSHGVVFLGEATSSCVCLFDMHSDNTMRLRCTVYLKNAFSFCIDDDGSLWVSQGNKLHVYRQFHRVRRDDIVMKIDRKIVLKDQTRKMKNKGRILSCMNILNSKGWTE